MNTLFMYKLHLDYTLFNYFLCLIPWKLFIFTQIFPLFLYFLNFRQSLKFFIFASNAILKLLQCIPLHSHLISSLAIHFIFRSLFLALRPFENNRFYWHSNSHILMTIHFQLNSNCSFNSSHLISSDFFRCVSNLLRCAAAVSCLTTSAPLCFVLFVSATVYASASRSRRRTCRCDSSTYQRGSYC